MQLGVTKIPRENRTENYFDMHFPMLILVYSKVTKNV